MKTIAASRLPGSFPNVHSDLLQTALLFRWPFILIGFLLVLIFVRTEDNQVVLFPLLTALLISMIFIDVLRVREGGASPFFQLGGFYGSMVTLYTIYPLIIYLANGMEHGPMSDNRLYVFQPTAAQIGSIAWWYVAYLGAFCATYLLVAGSGEQVVKHDEPAPASLIVVLVVFVALMYLIVYGFSTAFGTFSGVYASSLEPFLQLPLIARQILARAIGALATVQVIVATFLFTRYPGTRKFIIMYVGFVMFIGLQRQGARTAIFLLLLAAVALYHHLVRRVGFGVVVLGGFVGLAAFTFLGFLRDYRAAVSTVTLNNVLFSASEFQVIFGNVYALKHVHYAEGVFQGRADLYLADFAGVIPQQLLPFPKTNASQWFMFTYYPDAVPGSALAFGAIAEGVVGYGLAEVILRAIALALAFGLFHRALTSSRSSPWLIAFYIWVMVNSYHSFRTTTTLLVPWAVLQFILPAIALAVFHFLLVKATRRVRRIL